MKDSYLVSLYLGSDENERVKIGIKTCKDLLGVPIYGPKEWRIA